MPFLRIKDSTKDRMDELFLHAQAKDPSIKTYDDLQKLLLSKLDKPDYYKLIKEDMETLERHLKYLHDGTDPSKIEIIVYNLHEILMSELNDVSTMLLLVKRLKELKKEIE